MDTFRVRLNCVDHYQAVPNDEFDPPVPCAAAGENIKNRPRVSVIRVFGATETGQKVLMHLHGAFQYTYIEYSGSLIPEDVELAIRTLQLSIDHALAVSYRKNVYEGKTAYVAHISLVKGIPFYGFHVGFKFYLKIYLLNPMHMTRLADLLREGAVMKRLLQPYESHMQYLAQWMCDYNLYGCAYIDCAKIKFRGPVPQYLELSSDVHQWHDQSIPKQNISSEDQLTKQSHCSLEVDVCVRDILNRRGVEARPLHHDFIERIRPLPIDAKLVQSMAGLWKDETRRRKARMGLSDPNSSPFPPEVLITMSADPTNTDAGGWIHEQENRERVAQIAMEEQINGAGLKVTFDTFVKPIPLEKGVKTALESVEDLYPENLSVQSTNMDIKTAGRTSINPDGSQIIVDEGRVRELADAYMLSDSEGQRLKPQGQAASGNDQYVPQSTANGMEAQSLHLSTPISSSEFEKLGLRKAGDFTHIEEDTFEIPDEYVQDDPNDNFRPVAKRTIREVHSEPRLTKRRKLLVDREDLLSDVSTTDSEEGTQASTERGTGLSKAQSYNVQTTSGNGPYEPNQALRLHDQARESEGQGDQVGLKVIAPQTTLRFPVVKDANDTNTILRLSQQSSSSQKSPGIATHDHSRNPALFQTPPKKTSASTQKIPTSAAAAISAQPQVKVPLVLSGLPEPRGRDHVSIFQLRPPPRIQVQMTAENGSFPTVIYQDAFYSNEEDVPDRQREYAGREFKLQSRTVPYLSDFDASGTSLATLGRKPPLLLDQAIEEHAERKGRRWCKIQQWCIVTRPPRRDEVIHWLEENMQSGVILPVSAEKTTKARNRPLSQIQGPTQKNKHGNKYSQREVSASVKHETQYMSMMSLEVHVNTRGALAPNPELDEIGCLFWCVKTDDDVAANSRDGMSLGTLAVASEPGMARKIAYSVIGDIEEEPSELEALTKMVDIVRYYDPDILTGYEVHNSSWGYLIERARIKYDMNLCDELSRMKSQSHGRFGKNDDKWGFNHTSTIRITGRHTINIWRAMRSELNLLQYTMENVCFHLLHRRIPHYNFADLTKWYKSKNPRDLAKAVEYYASRVQMDLEILEANELVPRTSEQARLLGVDWFSVISRGSQFKVESLMFRIAKPENFILVSPSRRQVGGQNALECLPLVMEPQSDFYTSPLLVLDFQSLYPSVMIAYNYCYSTFLGRVVSWRGTNKMGFTDYRRAEQLIWLLKDHINIAPNGIMYAKTEVRKSLLAKMLGEILETRVMVKSGMKIDKDDKTLQTLLNNRQLALKLIANVTYGYTSASFSGRMPCSEIADSIVQTARETLEKAIALIHSVERWGAEVVYGDTDSLFVYLKGRTRMQAFDIGEEIAATITKMNPRPVKLKFEKVYHPCVLLAKKRYVGFKYEHRDQMEPDFDAKGIETVRRDGTPAEQKIEENALKILFRTSDLSQVKSFFQTQCAKIMRGKVSIQDFCFAKEVRLGTYSDKGPPPPGALISARRMLEDPRLEPQYGERVPYVVVTGGPGARLIDRCVAPEVLLNDAQSELDAEYYISKNIIPPLERIFNLVGANVRQWYEEMPKFQRIRKIEAGIATDGAEMALSKKTLESYMKSSTCLVCREMLDTELPLCNSCFDQASRSLLVLRGKLVRAEVKASQLAKVCRSCSGLAWREDIKCDSKDCPVFYSRMRHNAGLANTKAQILPAIKALEEKGDAAFAW